MKKQIVKYFIILVTGLIANNIALCASATECTHKIQPQLIKILTRKFLKFRMPSLKDLDQKSIDFDMSNGGDGCFAVASGDFGDGKYKKGYAILLISKINNKPKLFVSFHHNDAWKIYKLQSFCDTVKFCYVKTKQPGTYYRTQALDYSLNGSNELECITSNKQVISTGVLESTEIVYAYIKMKWVYVWIAD